MDDEMTDSGAPQAEEEKRTFVGAHVRQSVAKAAKLEAIKDGTTMQKWIEELLVRELATRNVAV
jgi:hypothetical protein